MHLSYTSGITCSTTMPIEVFLLESFGKQTLKIVNWCLKEEDGEKKSDMIDVVLNVHA